MPIITVEVSGLESGQLRTRFFSVTSSLEKLQFVKKQPFTWLVCHNPANVTQRRENAPCSQIAGKGL